MTKDPVLAQLPFHFCRNLFIVTPFAYWFGDVPPKQNTYVPIDCYTTFKPQIAYSGSYTRMETQFTYNIKTADHSVINTNWDIAISNVIEYGYNLLQYGRVHKGTIEVNTISKYRSLCWKCEVGRQFFRAGFFKNTDSKMCLFRYLYVTIQKRTILSYFNIRQKEENL